MYRHPDLLIQSFRIIQWEISWNYICVPFLVHAWHEKNARTKHKNKTCHWLVFLRLHSAQSGWNPQCSSTFLVNKQLQVSFVGPSLAHVCREKSPDSFEWQNDVLQFENLSIVSGYRILLPDPIAPKQLTRSCVDTVPCSIEYVVTYPGWLSWRLLPVYHVLAAPLVRLRVPKQHLKYHFSHCATVSSAAWHKRCEKCESMLGPYFSFLFCC